ncbi:BDN_1c_G0034020.mRNA.1.CDS.1 [Saccharomyces cerevisiae]|nr:BDN_1c_G0034020.mRNA.1.CDS.1 [Saccharomyces cerevisiae]CAI7320954.1 BDN_1c_G0034020.mRNA.1.CDS.1 [Saccharomyces cerevisiae]
MLYHYQRSGLLNTKPTPAPTPLPLKAKQTLSTNASARRPIKMAMLRDNRFHPVTDINKSV